MAIDCEEAAKKMSPEQIKNLLVFVKENTGKILSPHAQIVCDNATKIVEFYFAQKGEKE